MPASGYSADWRGSDSISHAYEWSNLIPVDPNRSGRCGVRFLCFQAADGFPRVPLRGARRIRWHPSGLWPHERLGLADALSLSAVLPPFIYSLCASAVKHLSRALGGAQIRHPDLVAARDLETSAGQRNVCDTALARSVTARRTLRCPGLPLWKCAILHRRAQYC